MQAPSDIKQRLSAILNRTAENYSIATFEGESVRAEKRLRERGDWPRDRMYLQVSDMPRDHVIDVAVEQARMAVEWATRASTEELLRIVDYPTGGSKWLAAWSELIDRGVAQ